MAKWFNDKVLSSNKKTVLFISTFIFFVLFLYQVFLLFNGTYFNSNSDDIVQYSPILGQYIEYLKSGNFSWFNFSNNFGASLFADVYYVPIDIFSIVTFLLSFFVNSAIAFSCAELLKVLLGVAVFAIFLQKCKFNNKIVLLVSFMYFCFGGPWVFSIYPTYFSLFFYLPMCLLVVKYYFEGKKWMLPLYSFALVLYNFYNAYTLFIFMVFVFIVDEIRDNYKGILNLIKNTFYFGIHIVLGVIMGMFIFIPSIIYILSYSIRNIFDFEIMFDFSIYMEMILKLFIYESGVINLNSGFDKASVYYQCHFSYYVGFLGLYLVLLLFYLKDRVSKIYKWVIVATIILMCIPLFSMLFSGVAVAYTRWFTFISVILLYFIAYVLNLLEKIELSKKEKVMPLIFIGTLFIALTIYVFAYLVAAAKYERAVYLSYSLSMLVLDFIIIALYALFFVSNQKDLCCSVVIVEMLIALLINFSVPLSSDDLIPVVEYYEEINDVVDNLEIEENSLDRIYLDYTFKYNSNRFTNVLTNERSFHSFITKYNYDYRELYSNLENVFLLKSFDLNRYSPNFSRLMDYKYIIVSKNEYDYNIDYLEKYYEDDDFLIFENRYYNPFYVYESYFDESEVLNYEDNNFLLFSRNLFDGVVLDENNYNLKRIDYSDNENIEVLDFITKVSLDKNENSYTEEINYDYGKKGVLYLRGDDIFKVSDLKLVGDQKEFLCESLGDVYKCSFNENFDTMEIKANDNISELEYIIFIEDEEESDIKYAFYKFDEKIENVYINYVLDIVYQMFLEDQFGNVRNCLNGFCSLNDFSAKYAMIRAFEDSFKSYEPLFLEYKLDDLSFYNNNKNDLNATNKSLEHEGSSVNVKYERISNSDKDQIVVLPITYSEEWYCEDNNYELVRANGGFLGIVVKNGVKNVDVSITFRPSGVKIGLLGSIVGFGIYGIYIGLLIYKKKKVQIDENI